MELNTKASLTPHPSLFIPNAFCMNANICKWNEKMQSGAVGWDWSLLGIVYKQDHEVQWISLREREERGRAKERV